MYLPNYQNGSVVNLMSSILKSVGYKSKYNQLPQLKPEEISKSKNIVLLVIDGLGYEYLMKKGKNSILKKNLRSKITSSFPSTTATTVIAFATGVPAQQHGLTAWDVYLKEVKTLASVLPFVSKKGKFPLNKAIDPKEIFDIKTYMEKLKIQTYRIMPKDIINSYVTKAYMGKSKPYSYKNLKGFFTNIKKAISSNNRKKLIYAYWPGFDSICHEDGPKSKNALNHFREIDSKLEKFASKFKDTILIISADHGQIQNKKSDVININKYKVLRDSISILAGEPRVRYCYVHPSKTKEFEKYVKTKLKNKCSIHKSKDLIKRNFFGLYKPHKKLKDRVGDYILIMKKNYIMEEEDDYLRGNHGGVSKEEMFVPLVIIKK